MSNITRYFDGEEVRFFLDAEGHTWLNAGDCCRKLAVGNITDALKRLKDSQKYRFDSIDVAGKSHRQWFISPQGMYKLAFTSRKPEAEAFTDWVTDVIEELRELGMPFGTSIRQNLELLKRMILAPDKRTWAKRFEREIFDRLEWFRGDRYIPGRPKKWHAGFLQRYVYQAAFGPELYKSLKEKCPKPRHWDNLHQQLTDKGLEVLVEHLSIIHSLLYSSATYVSFKRAFVIRFVDEPPQLSFDDDTPMLEG